MTPTILPGDYGIVNKWKLGARIFNVFDAIKGKKVTVHRLPGYGKIERNDIAVFNYPFTGKDTVGLNMRKYYCKRIIAIPGDTLEIRNCRFKARGINSSIGYVPAQEGLANFLGSVENPQDFLCYKSWPFDSTMNWTIRDFGPLFIPKKGSEISMTRENTILYGTFIAWEQQCQRPEWREGQAWIANKPLKKYTFEENYYFTSGDHAYNSADSRYWGLLPEPMIVGVGTFIWDSKDHASGKRRWDRIFIKLTN